MHTFQNSYIPMASVSVFGSPIFIGLVIALLIVAVAGVWWANKSTEDKDMVMVTAMCGAAMLVMGVIGIYSVVQSSNPVYLTEGQKIVKNVKEKYDVVTVNLIVPGASGFIKDPQTGNYLSTAWINRAQDEVVLSESYDLVVDANTGEPTLKKAESAASKTEPSTFLRR